MLNDDDDDDDDDEEDDDDDDSIVHNRPLCCATHSFCTCMTNLPCSHANERCNLFRWTTRRVTRDRWISNLDAQFETLD